MSKFVVVMFPDAATVHQATGVLKKLRAEGSIKLYASTIVAKDPRGKLSLQELTKEGLGGTAAGALIGGLAGLALGPLAATIGAAGGALIGNSADRIGQRAEAEFVESTSTELAPGKMVVVAEVAEEGVVAFEALMRAIGGTAVRKQPIDPHGSFPEQKNSVTPDQLN